MRIFRGAVLSFLFALFAATCCAQQASLVETKLADLLKEAYDTREMQVRLESVPAHLKQEIRVKSVKVHSMPDVGGKGLAIVEFAGEDGRLRTSYVPFRVYQKKKLFYMKRALLKGSPVSADDLGSKETYISENDLIYPEDLQDVAGKVLKRDVAPGMVLTTLILDSPQVIRRGEMVTIVAENRQLLVKAKGRAEEPGKVGERIRVKNLSSDREVAGRVASDGTVVIEF
jgi:flagella basal body P-ring formation protein FlgA